MDLSLVEWGGAAILFLALLGYIRSWRDEHLRMKCLELACSMKGKSPSVTASELVTYSAPLEKYVRTGKPKPTPPTQPPRATPTRV